MRQKSNVRISLLINIIKYKVKLFLFRDRNFTFHQLRGFIIGYVKQPKVEIKLKQPTVSARDPK